MTSPWWSRESLRSSRTSASTWSRPRRRLPVITDVDIVLYDTFGQVHGQGIDLADFVRDSGAKVVIYSWNLEPDLIERAIAEGASGYLSKVLTGPAIVEALERIMSGEIVILAGDQETSVGGAGDWPGRSVGLSPREAEVLALIARGLTNQEIAERAYLTINSVKSYIRSAYRKIGVERRTQAVLWALENGFQPDTERTIDPALRLRPTDPVQHSPPLTSQSFTCSSCHGRAADSRWPDACRFPRQRDGRDVAPGGRQLASGRATTPIARPADAMCPTGPCHESARSAYRARTRRPTGQRDQHQHDQMGHVRQCTLLSRGDR